MINMNTSLCVFFQFICLVWLCAKYICKYIYMCVLLTEPVPAYSSWHRGNMDNEEAHLSPRTGGKMIRQLLEEDSDPMLSPRFYAYGNSQQYLDDTEVPPSPPNTHSFIR